MDPCLHPFKDALAALGHRTLAKPPLSFAQCWLVLPFHQFPACSCTRIQKIVNSEPSQGLVLWGSWSCGIQNQVGEGARGRTGMAEAAPLKKSAGFWDSPSQTGTL